MALMKDAGVVVNSIAVNSQVYLHTVGIDGADYAWSVTNILSYAMDIVVLSEQTCP